MTSNLESSSLSSSSELSSSPSSMTSTFSSSYHTLNSHETIDPMSHIIKSRNSSKSKHANPLHHHQQHSTTITTSSSTSSVVDSFNENNKGTDYNANNFNYLVQQQQQQPVFYPTAASVAEQGFYQDFGYGYDSGQDYGIKQEFEGQSQHAPLVNYYNNCKSKSRFVTYGRDSI